jgi:RimJ/RimL family protein N-acetyltransferase
MLHDRELVTPEFNVFPASSSHGDVVGEIHAESWKAAYADFFSPEFFTEAVRLRRNRWHGVLAETEQTVMLAALHGRPLAYSYFGSSPVRQESAEILGFYGHPDGWGSGVAGALMTASLQRMRDDGFRGVHLWTLRDTSQSRRFYAKSGFAESGAVRGHDFGDGNPIQQVEYELSFR